MRDLHLWRLLRRRLYEPAEIIPLLEDLAARPISERGPFLGLLPSALENPDAAVRAAAVAVFAGARGRIALHHIIAGLQDDEQSVRLAAAEALRESIRGDDWARWAHVMFHPDPEVRRASLATDREFPPPYLYRMFLLPDPVHGDAIRQQLVANPLPGDTIPQILDFLRRGLLDQPLARRLAARLDWSAWQAFFLGFFPAHDDFDALLARTMEPNWPAVMMPEYHPDQLDDVLHLFWDTDPVESGQVSPSDHFFRLLLEGGVGEQPKFHQWMAYTLLGVAAQRKNWPRGALEACAVFHPAMFTCPWLTADLRREAIGGLHRAGQRCKRRPARDEVKTLITGELGQPEAGRFDLWAIGGLLRLLEENPYATLIEWLGLTPIVDAARANVDPVPAFLGLKDESEKGRQHLLNRILEKPWPARDRLVALLAWAAPTQDARLLELFEEPDDALRIFAEMLALEPAGLTVADKGVQAIARVVGRAIPPAPFLQLWLARPEPEKSALAKAVLGRVCRRLRRAFSQTAAALETPLLLKLLSAINLCPDFPYDQEARLAAALEEHDDEAVCLWAAPRLEETPRFKAGLFDRLRSLPETASPDLDACTSILTASGPPAAVAELLARFGSVETDFIQRLEKSLSEFWLKEARLPLFGHALLATQERKAGSAAAAQELHASAFGKALLTHWPDGIAAALAHSQSLAWPPLRTRVWDATIRAMEAWRDSDPLRLSLVWNDALGDMLLGLLDGDRGETAARMLTLWADTGAGPLVLQRLHDHVIARVPELNDRVRNLFGALGAGATEAAAVVDEAEARRRVTASEDLDFLAGAARQPNAAAEAAGRLIEIGEDGLARLVGLFRQPVPPPTLAAIANTVRDWPVGRAREDLRALASDATVVPESRYRAAWGLVQAGETTLLPAMIDAACAPGPAGWFQEADRAYLAEVAPEARTLQMRLLQSPHAPAQVTAVHYLIAQVPPDGVADALRGFLDGDGPRDAGAKMLAAEWLATQGEKEAVLPLLLQGEQQETPRYPELFSRLPEDTLVSVINGMLAAGFGEVAEKSLLAMLKNPGVGLWAQESGLARLLSDAETEEVRTGAREALGPHPGRLRRLRRVAETFAWGVRIGRELTGKLFTLEMIANEQLGYTRFRENKLYITPMPLLRGVQNGREVVRALILHEYGHHMYHRGSENEAVWQKAQNENLHQLLNLVSDEHLERNLRSLDMDFGDQLKMLGAFAFQHASREFAVDTLLNTLGGRAFEVLVTVPLGAARQRNCVAVSSGRMLREMERSGMSFARFVRALRMGLGNRHEDPKVDQGLELFKGRFRHSTMEQMYEISKKLREIFGQETDMLNSFSMDSALCDGDPSLLDGISREELQREIQDTLKQGTYRSPPPDGVLGGLGMNKGPEENFDLIHEVIQMQHEKAAHKVYEQKVQRQADKMRRYFDELGIGWEPQRLRVRGRSFDRTRVNAVVLRNDPRMLMARELRSQTDLFLGVVIDCSGSMAGFQSMEKAKLFGTLLAEAAKDNRGIDVRLFGFTDKVIYDAGSSQRCAVHALRAGGGNNDAAGLWHAALVAKASKRRAKLLVQISDGAPTECTVTALRSLVERLTKRWKFCCAQVAVRPLEEICFPNYVLLEDNNLEACTRQFGLVIAKLVRQALRGG